MARTFLDIPYRDRAIARKAGAKFDQSWHKWYVDKDVPAELARYRRISFDDALSVGIDRELGQKTAYAIHCDEHVMCPLAARGKCLAIPRALDQAICPCARLEMTQRDSRDDNFTKRIQQMPNHLMLVAPKELHFAHVGSRWTYIGIEHVKVILDPDHDEERRRSKNVFDTRPVIRARSNPDIVLDDDGDGGETILPKALVTPQLLHDIASVDPRWNNHRITQYATRTVPKLMADVRRADQQLFDDYVAAFGRPKPADETGRVAYLATCRQGAKWQSPEGTWVLDGDRLVSDDFTSRLCGPQGMGSIQGAHISIPVTPKTTIAIQSMSQTNESTRFA